MSNKMLNLEKVLARLAQVPLVVQQEVGDGLAKEVDDLVDAQRRAAPTETEVDPEHAFRDSIHGYQNPDRPLSYRVIADAKDKDGAFIGTSIEQGHRTPGGKHVAAKPSFYPTYRARKKGMRRRLNARAKAAINKLYPG